MKQFCSGLNKNGRHRFIHVLEHLAIGSGIIRFGLVGVSVVLLEEICYFGGGFEVVYAQVMLNAAYNLLLSLDQDRTLSNFFGTLSPLLPAPAMLLAMMIMD